MRQLRNPEQSQIQDDPVTGWSWTPNNISQVNGACIVGLATWMRSCFSLESITRLPSRANFLSHISQGWVGLLIISFSLQFYWSFPKAFFGSTVAWQRWDPALLRAPPIVRLSVPLPLSTRSTVTIPERLGWRLYCPPKKFLISSCLHLLSTRVLSAACHFQKDAPFTRKASSLV